MPITGKFDGVLAGFEIESGLVWLTASETKFEVKRRRQLIDSIGLGKEGRIFNKKSNHAVGHALAGRIKHFQIRGAIERLCWPGRDQLPDRLVE